MEELSIEKFSPAKADLLAIVAKTKETDLTDPEAVKLNRLNLRDTRVMIQKTGKAMRENALKFQKEVIAKEKELIEIIEPEEVRLKQVEDEHNLKMEMEKRRDELPSRLEALAGVGDGLPNEENEILAMDDNEFNAYRLRRIDAKLEKDRADLETAKEKEAIERVARERAEAEARARVEREAAAKRAEEDAKAIALRNADDVVAAAKRKQEQDKIDAERKIIEDEKNRLAAEARAREKAEADRKAEVELKEREAKALAEKQATEAKMANFVKWSDENKYNAETDLIEWKNGVAYMYRLVATYQPKE